MKRKNGAFNLFARVLPPICISYLYLRKSQSSRELLLIKK